MRFPMSASPSSRAIYDPQRSPASSRTGASVAPPLWPPQVFVGGGVPPHRMAKEQNVDTRTLSVITPYERLHGHKPNLDSVPEVGAEGLGAQLQRHQAGCARHHGLLGGLRQGQSPRAPDLLAGEALDFSRA